jgi:hypothetical protein
MSIVLELVRPVSTEKKSAFSNENTLENRVKKNASAALAILRANNMISSDCSAHAKRQA